MTQEGRIPDHIMDDLGINNKQTEGQCDECWKSCRIKREHPYKDDLFVCESCYSDILMEETGFDEQLEDDFDVDEV